MTIRKNGTHDRNFIKEIDTMGKVAREVVEKSGINLEQLLKKLVAAVRSTLSGGREKTSQ